MPILKSVQLCWMTLTFIYVYITWITWITCSCPPHPSCLFTFHKIADQHVSVIQVLLRIDLQLWVWTPTNMHATVQTAISVLHEHAPTRTPEKWVKYVDLHAFIWVSINAHWVIQIKLWMYEQPTSTMFNIESEHHLCFSQSKSDSRVWNPVYVKWHRKFHRNWKL